MKIYIQRPESICTYGAWTWIVKGYISAWKAKGYEVLQYDHLEEIDVSQKFDLMTYDIYIKNQKCLDVVSKAHRAYIFVASNKFPSPWGDHPNWLTPLSDNYIDKINQMKDVYLWSWAHAERNDYFYKWKKINTVPLAFDHLNYHPVEDSRFAFDVCYIGSWSNNGFDEKRKIMIDHFKEIKKLNLKCGFFINKGLDEISIQQEANILFNSKIALNLHDHFQRVLGLDHNERTFKSLGINGFLISDKVAILEEDFPNVPTAATPKEMVNLIEKYLSCDLTEEKQKNAKKQRKHS